MVLAGVWQLRVYASQGAEAAARRAAEPSVPLSAVAPIGAPIRDGYGRTVTVGGVYEAEHEVRVPVANRTDAHRVVNLFRTDDGRALAVVRGVVVGLDPGLPPPGGPQELRGVLLPSEEAVASPGGPEELGSVRVPQLAQSWPGPLVEGFVTLSAPDAAAQGLEPAVVTLPEGRGRLRNGAYGLQWWLFSGFTLVMAVRIARDVGRTPSAPPRLPSHDG